MSGFIIMQKKIKTLFLIIVIIGLIVVGLSKIEKKSLVIKEAETGKIIWQRPVTKEVKFAIEYLHSVEKTPVWEYFQVKGGKLYLTGTRYESYGAGLPFLKKHNYIVSDDKFEIKEINEQLEKIELRVSDYAKHKFIVNGQEYKLYQMTEPMNLVVIDLKVMNQLELLTQKIIG